MGVVLIKASEIWHKLVSVLMNVWKVCLSAKCTCAKGKASPDFLEHTLSCLEAPIPSLLMWGTEGKPAPEGKTVHLG